MASDPGEKQGKSIHVEPAGGICSSSEREKLGYRGYGLKIFWNLYVFFALSSNKHNPDLGYKKKKEKENQFEKDFALTVSLTFIEDVRLRVPSDPSQSRGAPEISENVVEEPYYRPLLQAAFRGDWEFATRFFKRDAASKTAKITSRSETVLHIAALSAHDQFLENLVELLSPYPKALEEVDCDGRTALHNAVLAGRIRMVKALVRSNPKLTQLADNKERVPLAISAVEASMHKEITWFLAKSTTDDGPSRPFSSPSAIDTFIDLAHTGHHDITLYLVGRYPHLMTMKSKNYHERSILWVLAATESDFPGGTKLSVVEALIYKCIPVNLNYKPANKNSDPVPKIKRVHEVKLRHVAAVELAKQICIAISDMNITEIIKFFEDEQLLLQATANGFSELVKLCIQFFPQLIRISPCGKSLTRIAMVSRQERTLRLFLKVSSANEVSLVPAPTRPESFDMMSDVVTYDPRFSSETNVAGAAFKLQRELQWYKAVEKWVASGVIGSKKGNKTFWNRFEENHEGLLESGEKWMKDTANSCMLISTLIATVLFAAALPGGNDNNSGVPLLLGEDSLLIFAISDALGLFSSVTAILLFLAILTSRYEVQDFLHSLPKKIIMALSLLFLSLAFMLVAFAATLTMVLDTRLEWVLIPITLLASILVALFAILQLPLLYQMVKSTFGPSIFRPEGIWDGIDYTKQD
ncbi:hypothetical protein EUGRSUZ_C03493 [Eucalyptus grandis]|uniref:Uncharacterized protein n=2 Tax=Eucalyptus grandis TaxID=71139 RepID=A0ACC3LIP4_EUCGR|nr:hypothetical protein EUGRSUZ_C03493 [Eucalyptus grandis]